MAALDHGLPGDVLWSWDMFKISSARTMAYELGQLL
jgi:hypothetical protein